MYFILTLVPRDNYYSFREKAILYGSEKWWISGEQKTMVAMVTLWRHLKMQKMEKICKNLYRMSVKKVSTGKHSVIYNSYKNVV